jgi:hypothetical protein
MGSRKFIATTIGEYLNEQTEPQNNIKDILIKRIPFLKEYNIFKDPRDEKRLEAQRVIFNENVKIMMGNEIINFPQYNVSSEIIYYPHRINDNTFHHFIIKNQFPTMQPKEMDDLTFKVFILAKKQLEKKLSYSKEIMIKNGEEIPKNELDKIINEMNGVLFKIEEFTEKNNINLF